MAGAFGCRTADHQSSNCRMLCTPNHCWGNGSNCKKHARICSCVHSPNMASHLHAEGMAACRHNPQASTPCISCCSSCHTPRMSMPISDPVWVMGFFLAPHQHQPSLSQSCASASSDLEDNYCPPNRSLQVVRGGCSRLRTQHLAQDPCWAFSLAVVTGIELAQTGIELAQWAFSLAVATGVDLVQTVDVGQWEQRSCAKYCPPCSAPSLVPGNSSRPASGCSHSRCPSQF